MLKQTDRQTIFEKGKEEQQTIIKKLKKPQKNWLKAEFETGNIYTQSVTKCFSI